jgi:hypothetical protein
VFRTLQEALSALEWTAIGLVIAVGALAILTGRTVGYAIVLVVGLGVVVGVRGVMHRSLRDAIEFGAESGAMWERSSGGRRSPTMAAVYQLAEKQRKPVRR